MYKEEILIPKRRIGVLIGKAGQSKKDLQKQIGCSIRVDKEGNVTISSEDSLNVFVGKQIIKAIARGFSIQNALRLKRDDFMLELIDLDEWTRTKNDMNRMKARIIGREGNTKKRIIESTGCEMVISGKTIGLIGETENVALARQALTKLLKGAKHVTVYRFLDEKLRESKRKNIEF